LDLPMEVWPYRPQPLQWQKEQEMQVAAF